jgi:hypothetical protein
MRTRRSGDGTSPKLMLGVDEVREFLGLGGVLKRPMIWGLCEGKTLLGLDRNLRYIVGVQFQSNYDRKVYFQQRYVKSLVLLPEVNPDGIWKKASHAQEAY